LTDPIDPMAIAAVRIADEDRDRTGSLDLSGLGLRELPEALFSLKHLHELSLGKALANPNTPLNLINDQRDRLTALKNLEVLSVARTDLKELDFVEIFHALKSLNCQFTEITNLNPISKLLNLESLDCRFTQIRDLGPLAKLKSLQYVNLSSTKVANLEPLSDLTNLTELYCDNTDVDDLTPISRSECLERLWCDCKGLSDLGPIKNVRTLKSITFSNSKIDDLSPLSGLPEISSLWLSNTTVHDLSPLSRLTKLYSLRMSNTRVTDLSPITSCQELNVLNISESRISDITPLSRLANLRELHCGGTDVNDISSLSNNLKLSTIDFSGNKLTSLPIEIWGMNSLKSLVLYNTQIADVPPEVLSSGPGMNCLESIRAHFADLASEPSGDASVRLLLLGNGGVGKTQIARRLSNQAFEPEWDSTHGIRIASVQPTDSTAAKLHLQIWDFGGQDIYHGTHALFLRSPAVLAVVWSDDQEKRRSYDLDGLKFRNHPLAYWVDVARHQSDPDSPVLVIQNKCDHPADEAETFPISAEALETMPHLQQLRVSAKEGRGLDALTNALEVAIGQLPDSARFGWRRIGAGRLRVQKRLESLRDKDSSLPREQRRHHLLDRHAFDLICAEEGGVSSPELLLAYLNANGALIHQPGLFGDQIVLDQNWALDAIYAVFDRKKVYHELRRCGGRFTRALLGLLVWRGYSDAEQDLLIAVMRSCGICFLHRRFSDRESENIEYIAPDLLPEQEAVAGAIAARWSDGSAGEAAEFRYALLHGGLIRSVMAAIGELAGMDALYWRGGLCAYEADSRSKVLIEEEMGTGWRGVIRIRTQDGQAALLLDRIVSVVERAQDQLGLRPVEIERSSIVTKPLESAGMLFRQEKPMVPEWYISYAWGDDRAPEGRAREEVVDRLCAAAASQGREILRDKNVLGFGDSISTFMRRIGAGDRVFVILSEKYLRSPHCMFELSEVWRTSKHEGEDFLKRIRIYALPDAKVWEPEDWADWAIYWKEKHDALDRRAREHGGAILGEPGLRRLIHMQRFYTQVADILGVLADIVQPRTFEELEQYGFDDAPE
jgi:internalin A